MLVSILPDLFAGDNPSGDVTTAPWRLRPIVCQECGLMIAEIACPLEDEGQIGPLAPIYIKPMGCLCTLPAGWLRALVEDAESGRKISCGWQGRLLSALICARVPGGRFAAQICEEVLPLREELVEFARRRLGRP